MAMVEKDESSSMHVVVFPWLAFGHLLPFLSLSERLASRGHRVSFVSTPRNIQRLPPVAPALAARVSLVPLPLPSVDGLPDGAESTADVPFDKFGLHLKAFDDLVGPFSEFLDAAERRPDWIISDIMHHWVAVAARGVPGAMIFLCNANFSAFVGGQPPVRRPTFEAEQWANGACTEDSSGISLVNRFFMTLERCQLVAVRSCVEFEPRDLAVLPTLYKKPVFPLGLLPPSPTSRHLVAGEEYDSFFTWLDDQPARSVLYVALGSEAPLRAEQLRELARGLELSGERFLWTLRKPNAGGDDDSGRATCTASILPEGFEARTACRGVVAMGWVPQTRILANAAVGAFLTHCGWNSLVEGLQHGQPLVLLPIFADQGANARLMEDRAVGVQVARDDDDGSFDGEGVAAAVRTVMMEEEGRVLEANAKKLQVIFADMARHESCIDAFVKQLMSYYNK